MRPTLLQIWVFVALTPSRVWLGDSEQDDVLCPYPSCDGRWGVEGKGAVIN